MIQSTRPHSILSKKTRFGNENFLYMRNAPALSWRLDPDESLSDWTLRVTSSTNPSPKHRFPDGHSLSSSSPRSFLGNPPGVVGPKIYFVHRTQLAVGPRRSEYFAKLFKMQSDLNKQRVEEARDDTGDNYRTPKTTTKIELLPSAATYFPVMLDYLYSAPGTSLDINTKSAVALRHLASSFGIKVLFDETTSFIQNDLSPETAPFYLVEAKVFKNDKIASTAIKMISKNFKDTKLTSLSILMPQDMVDIVQSEHLNHSGSEAFSSKIASYCRCRREELTLDVLKSLTPSAVMPAIAEDETLFFLHLLQCLGDKVSMDSSDPDKRSKNDRFVPRSLSARCFDLAPLLLHTVLRQTSIANVANTGSKAALRQHENNMEMYHALPDHVKVQLLEKVHGKPDLPSKEQMQEIEKQMKQKAKSKEKAAEREKQAKKQARRMHEEMKMLKNTYDKKVGYLRHKLEFKEEELIRVISESEREKQISKKTTPSPLSGSSGSFNYMFDSQSTTVPREEQKR